jgi:hypothetical protein
MINAADFKKLLALEQKDYRIFIDNEEVSGLVYDEDLDPEEFIDGTEESIRCHFSFVHDRYDTICYLEEYKKGNWTVEKHEEVDWRSL